MKTRLAELDMLRTAAVLLVIGHHWSQFVYQGSFATKLMWRVGWVGVDLFFVLSGFLVSGLLFREYMKHGKVDVVRFFIRRGLKIYPGFWAMMAYSVVPFYIIPGLRHSEKAMLPLSRLAAELLFVQNYFAGIWNHTWSLAIEEHFYLLLGLFVAFITRRRSVKGSVRHAVVPVVVVCLACLLARILWARYVGYSWFRIYAPTHMRLDALLFGVLLSYAYHFKRERLVRMVEGNRWLILAGSLVLVSSCVVFPKEAPFMYTFGLPCLTVGFGGLMMLLLIVFGSTVNRFSRITNPIAYVGRHSYSIYLWHMPVLKMTIFASLTLGGPFANYYTELWTYLIGALGVGIIAAKLVELPAIAVRDRLFPSRSAAA
jgi:peptidoglycan/LPS O-acetylase OafA/YrhL